MSDESKPSEKRPYTKPKLTPLRLAADEVLAIGCKSIAGAGPTGANCGLLGTACFDSGS